MMSNENVFQCDCYWQASGYSALGAKFLGTKKLSNKVVFLFQDDESLQNAIQRYVADDRSNLGVKSILTFARDFKQMLFNTL